jgi:hypothetical protein
MLLCFAEPMLSCYRSASALLTYAQASTAVTWCVRAMAGFLNDEQGNVFVVTRPHEGAPGRGLVFKLGCGKACATVGAATGGGGGGAG